MATFVPVPPRRTVRKTPRLGSAVPTSLGGSPVRRVARAGTVSRLTTPARSTPGHGDKMSVIRSDRSSMDIDEVGGRRHKDSTVMFARSKEMLVTFYAHLPAEVKQVLRNADFFGEEYTGDIDTVTGFALVASVQTCFVWQYAQALKGTPTCYIFSSPLNYSRKAAPLHVLVPYGHNREPGLILISVEGEVRMWDSIGIGLAGGSNYSTSHLELASDEIVTTLTRADTHIYIASTSIGRFFHLSLTSTGGKTHLSIHPFTPPAHASVSLTRLLPRFWSSSSSSSTLQPQPGNVNAFVVSGKDVWALVDTRIQKWTLGEWEEVIQDEDVLDLVRDKLREQMGSAIESDDTKLDLEFLDLRVDSSGTIVILVSYAGTEEDIGMDIGSIPRRIYALARLSYISETFSVQEVQSVPYQSTSSSGAPMHPRIKLLHDDALVVIQFGDAIALCARDSQYQDRLTLKSNADRTLGVGVLQEENAVLVLTAATMMKAIVDVEAVTHFDPETGRAGLIKSIMTQAILYGSNSDNPLQFSFPPEVDGESLMQGAEQLSTAVLESDTEVVRPNHDLSAQMTGRKERLSWLIRFINDNAVLAKMSQSSRQRLATDAEKLYSCHQLWLQHNELLAAGNTHTVLSEAIQSFMGECGEGHHEDVVRAFFRLKVGDIGRLLVRVLDVASNASYDRDRKAGDVLLETTRIVLTLLKSAFDYRDYNAGVYGIEYPMIKPWTSKPAAIDIVLRLFDTMTKTVEAAASASGEPSPAAALNAQLPDLAAVLFACIREQLEWLGSPYVGEDLAVGQEHQELEERFAQLRPEVLETLRRNGHGSFAFDLAEEYRDFRSLAFLCHKGTVYPPEENPNLLRIQNYVDKFKEAFTTELYMWYIEHGELRTMFAQEYMYSDYMDKFFAEHPHPSISWIYDLGKRRHGAASQTLLAEAQSQKDLATRHVILSIGKLAQLAQAHEPEATLDESVLEAYHDSLDFVSVQEALVAELKEALVSIRGKQSLEAQVEAIARAKTTELVGKKALLTLFKQLVRQVLQGKALSLEDVVDVLTLKDNYDTVNDYVTALHLLARDTSLPQGRKMSAFRSVWRRIYIHDDWSTIRQTSNITDAELIQRFQNTALHAALAFVLAQPANADGLDLPPDRAEPPPAPAEAASRWPGMAPEQVEALLQDYEAEGAEVEGLGLEDVYQRVRELAVYNVVHGSELASG